MYVCLFIVVDTVVWLCCVLAYFQKEAQPEMLPAIHTVSITRFPLRRFSPGAGLLRNLYSHR